MNISRRFFLVGAAGVATFTNGCVVPFFKGSKRWWKGMLHCHSLRSDGRAFPEEVIAMYRDRGYDFLSVTDHNRAGVDTADWRDVVETSAEWPPAILTSAFERYKASFGDKVDAREVDGKLQVRIKTFAETAKQFNSSGEFLLLPGVEVTDYVNKPHRDVHMNVINVPSGVPSREDKFYVCSQELASAPKLIADTFAEAKSQAGGRKFLFTVNHPQWRYWDVLPEDVLDNRDVRFFELVNNDCENGFQPPKWLRLTNEQFWDVVNAHRCERGMPLMYAMGTDDTHWYFDQEKTCFGGAWIHVRSGRLDADSLIDAMDAGDFYVSNGVTLNDVEFDRASKRLTVSVKPEDGVNYKIRFCVTKKNFSHDVEHRTIMVKDGLERNVPIYPENVFGVVAKTVEGVTASYQMAEDDLYVRAEVVSDCVSAYYARFGKAIYYPKMKTAWTQPYR